MNSEIEQRIVAMYFDNKDFEKNAQQTIGTLGQLKEGLNLEDSVKGFDELDKAGKKLNLNQARTSVNNLKNSLSGLGSVIQKAFNIGTAPLHALDNFFNTFRGYVGKFVGFDLASKFVNSLESAIQQLTVAPIQAGWNMYQANIDSTKTIMSGTMKSYKEQMSAVNSDWTYSEAEHMDFVKGKLKDLSNYAAKTVFSLQDMTSNVGKFTNQNIDLETSVTAMKGIANMTAKAGQGAQQASMAMYNFSQALGVGKMTTLDWKSIENANIATTELKDMFIMTAAAAGKLQKEVEKIDGKEVEKFFITVDKNGKKLAKDKWMEVSAENFRETLQQGWLDKDTMLHVMQLYSNEGFDFDTLAAWGFDIKDTELMEQLKAVGEEAMLAATQVRTFSKMWDALTESVQSSWADSMELIFGDMTEATEFWTTINDKIGGIMDKIGEERNNILREWRGETWDENTQAWIRLDNSIDGREDLIQGIYGVIDAAKSLGGAFSSAWADVFGSLTGKKLQEITKGFRDFIDRFKTWLGDINEAGSRLNKIKTGLSGVFSILKVVWEVVKNLFGILKAAIKPFIDPIINLFGKLGKWIKLDDVKNLGEMLSTLRDRFTQLWNKLAGLGWSGAFQKIGEWIGNLWSRIREGISNFMEENGLGGVRDWFVGLGDSIKSGYEAVVSWWNSDENVISNFFKGVWDTVTQWFQISYDEKGNEIRSPIVQFFYRIKSGVSEAFESVKSWWEGSGIPQFFSNIWKAISEAFMPKMTGVYYDGSGRHETYGNSPFVQFFVDTWEGIKNAFEEVKSWGIWNTIGTFFSGVWDTLSGIFKPVDQYDDRGFMLNEKGNSPFVQFFIDTWEGIKNAFEEVKSWGIWNSIGSFFTGVWDTISGIFKPVDLYDDRGFMLNQKGDSPVVAFFKSTWETLKNAFLEVRKWDGWKTIKKFFTDIWDSVSGIFTPTEITRYNGSMLETKFEDAPIIKFFKDTWETIKSVFTEISDWWNDPDNQVSGFFRNIWSTIMSLFNGTGDVAEIVGKSSDKINDAADSVSEDGKTEGSIGILQRIIDTVKNFITEVIDKVAGVKIPPELITFFNGLFEFVLGVANKLGEIMGTVGRALSGKATDVDWVWIGVGAVVAAIVKIMDFLNNKNLAKIETQTFSQKFLSLSLGLLAIAAAISLLTTIDQGKMLAAAGVLAGLGIVIGVILNFVNNIKANNEANQVKSTVTERLVGKLIDALKVVGSIAVVMALLPSVIDAFGKAKALAPELDGLDIMGIMTSVVIAVVGISAGLALVNKMTGGSGLNIAMAAKSAVALMAFISIVGAVIGGLGAALEGIFGTANVVEALQQGGQILTAIGEALSGLIGGFIGGIVGAVKSAFAGKSDQEKIDEAMKILESLAARVEGFTSDKNSGIIRILNAIGLLSQVVKDIPDSSSIENFSKQLEPLAVGIMKFGITVNGFNVNDGLRGWDTSALYENIEKTTDIFGMFNKGLGDMGLSKHNAEKFIAGIDYLNTNFTEDRFDALGKITAGIVEAFAKAVDVESPEMTNMSSLLMDNLSKAIKIGLSGDGTYALGVFDATPIVDAIVLALGAGESAIATAVHDMVQNAMNELGNNNVETGLGLVMPDMGDTMNPIISLLGGNMEGAFSNLFGNLDIDSQLTSAIYGQGGTATNPTKDSLFGQLTGLQSQMESFEFPDMSAKLMDAMKLTDENGESIDIVSDLRETLATFETELNETMSFEIRIVPTYDFSNLKAETLQAMLNDYPIKVPFGQNGYNIPDMIRVDFSGIGAELDLNGIKYRLDNINASVGANGVNTVAAIDRMAAHIDRISAAIAQIQLNVDMSGMIPVIDRELGKRAATSSATGVSSMLSNPYQIVQRTKPVPMTE